MKIYILIFIIIYQINLVAGEPYLIARNIKTLKKEFGSSYLFDSTEYGYDAKQQFVVFIEGGKVTEAKKLAQKLLEIKEAYYTKIRCPRVYETPVYVYIFKNKDRFFQVTKSEAIAYVITIKNPYVGQNSYVKFINAYIDSDIDRTLIHEFIHVLNQDIANAKHLSNNEIIQIPRAFDEGLAMYFEYFNSDKTGLEKDFCKFIYKDSKLFTFKELVNFIEYPYDTWLFYIQSFLIIDFLATKNLLPNVYNFIKWYSESIRKLSQKKKTYKNDIEIMKAFNQSFGNVFSYDDFNKIYESFLDTLIVDLKNKYPQVNEN